MSTRAYVAVEHSDGKISVIYSHWDGYPEGLGVTLKESYNSMEKALALVERGDVSVVADTIEQSKFYAERESWDEIDPNPHNEEWETVKPRVLDSIDEFADFAEESWTEWHYLFTDKWMIKGASETEYKPL